MKRSKEAKERWRLSTTCFVFAVDQSGERKREWVVHYTPFQTVATFQLPEHARLFVEAMEEKHGK